MTGDQAVPIVSVGFGWTPILLTIANLLLGGVMVAIIRSRPALKKIAADREANLLSERAKEMQDMRERIDKLEAMLTQKDKQHEAERAADRHRINNLSQCLDALLLLIEQDPAKAAEAASRVRGMRADQLQRENAERAAIRAAAITDAKMNGSGE